MDAFAADAEMMLELEIELVGLLTIVVVVVEDEDACGGLFEVVGVLFALLECGFDEDDGFRLAEL